jgi:hypothetical protein
VRDNRRRDYFPIPIARSLSGWCEEEQLDSKTRLLCDEVRKAGQNSGHLHANAKLAHLATDIGWSGRPDLT